MSVDLLLPPLGASDDDLSDLLRLHLRRLATADELEEARRDLLRLHREHGELLWEDHDARAAEAVRADAAAELALARELARRAQWAEEAAEDAREAEFLAARQRRRERAARAAAARRRGAFSRRGRPPSLLVALLADPGVRLALLLLDAAARVLPDLVETYVRHRRARAAEAAALGPALPMQQEEFAALLVAYARGKALGGPSPSAVLGAERLPWEVVAYINACHGSQAADLAREWDGHAVGGSAPARVALRWLRAGGRAVGLAHPEAVGATAGPPLGLLPLPPPDDDAAPDGAPVPPAPSKRR